MHTVYAIPYIVKQNLNESSAQKLFRDKLLALWPAIKGSLAEVRKPCIRPTALFVLAATSTPTTC